MVMLIVAVLLLASLAAVAGCAQETNGVVRGGVAPSTTVRSAVDADLPSPSTSTTEPVEVSAPTIADRDALVAAAAAAAAQFATLDAELAALDGALADVEVAGR